MTSTNWRQRARKEVTIYFGLLPLMFGAMYLPFTIAGLYPNYAFVSPALVTVGTIVFVLVRISLDAPSLLAKRLIGAFALGLVTGYFAFQIAWAKLLHSWYEYSIALLGYAFALWCIIKFVDLRVEQWRH
jgi:hypothetical protein